MLLSNLLTTQLYAQCDHFTGACASSFSGLIGSEPDWVSTSRCITGPVVVNNDFVIDATTLECSPTASITVNVYQIQFKDKQGNPHNSKFIVLKANN